MLNVKSAHSKYGSMRSRLWRRTHKAIFRPSVIVNTNAPQCALARRFDIQDVETGYNGYRIKWKTD